MQDFPSCCCELMMCSSLLCRPEERPSWICLNANSAAQLAYSAAERVVRTDLAPSSRLWIVGQSIIAAGRTMMVDRC